MNVTLGESQITSGQNTNVTVTNTSTHLNSPNARKILKGHVAFSALFDSKERFDPPKCHPETRTAILQSLSDWACNTSTNPTPVLWLRGAVGAGKSAIAQTLTERWTEIGMLVLSFFFSRTAEGRNSNVRLVATLAYQLSLVVPPTWPHIEKVLREDMGIFEKSLRSQFVELIIKPLKAAALEAPIDKVVIVIDGLDECCIAVDNIGHEDQQRHILEALAEIVRGNKHLLCFLIASRPERQIRTCFQSPLLASTTHIIDLSTAKGSDEDIELFLRCSFDTIRSQHPYLDQSWPSNNAIQHLVFTSSGHFIYASTAMKHIGRPRHDPQESLRAVLDAASARDSRESPLAALDALYILILHTVTPSSLPFIFHILALMLSDGSTTDHYFIDIQNGSPAFFDKYLCLSPGSTYCHLVDMHSLLNVPSQDKQDNYATAKIALVHASFGEFISNPFRSQRFHSLLIQARADGLLQHLKHVYIQILSLDLGHSQGYNSWPTAGDHDVTGQFDMPFFFEVCSQMEGTEPLEGLATGIHALLGPNWEFSRYVRRLNLTHMGTSRDRASMHALFSRQPYSLLSISLYLQKCGMTSPMVTYSRKDIDTMLKSSFDPPVGSLVAGEPEAATRVEERGKGLKARFLLFRKKIWKVLLGQWAQE